MEGASTPSPRPGPSRSDSDTSDVERAASTSRRSKKDRHIRKLEKRLREVESRPRLAHHPGDDKLIPVYDPQKSDLAIDVWVRRVDELADNYHWDNLTIVRLMSNRLVGMARRWYDSQEQLTTSWRKIKKN